MKSSKNAFALGLALSCIAGQAHAASDVWVQFGNDFETQLDVATFDAGVADFNAAEIATIESLILSEFDRVYADYNITFHTSDPGGTREIVNFGASGSSSLGLAPLDFGNLSAAGGTARVFTANFDFFIEPFEPRAQQINEIGIGLAGTGAHELMHAMGGPHLAAYSDPGITPANYASTGGLQNQYIIATGSTGLSEVEREAQRVLSPWSRVILDVAGGLTVFGGGISVVDNPVVQELESGDAGSTAGTAQALSLTAGDTSGQDIGLVFGDMDGSGSDVDLYSFTTIGEGSITAEIWSARRLGANIDGVLTLYDTDGTTVLATNDDLEYIGDSIYTGTSQGPDPFLLNVELDAAGTYYLEVAAISGAAENPGDDYFLLFGVTQVPEPGSLALLAIGGLLLGHRRRAA